MSETDRPALEEEIEVTSEMIEAGAGAWAMFDAGDRLDWLLASVYRAMYSARANGSPRPRRPVESLPLGQCAAQRLQSWYVTVCDEPDQIEYRIVDTQHRSDTPDKQPGMTESPVEEGVGAHSLLRLRGKRVQRSNQ